MGDDETSGQMTVDEWLQHPAIGVPASSFTQVAEPNESVDPGSGQPNQSVDPDANQPNQSVDPDAGQPNQSVDPNADQPNQSVDPDATQPNQSVDPDAGQPNQSVAPDVGQPNQSVDPNADQPNQSVDPDAGQPNQCVDPNAGQPEPEQDSDSPEDPDAGLNQDYNSALQAGDWPTAAEKLNGFNTDDIGSRLRALSRDQINSLHQGALDNPRVGPQSNLAKLTETITLQIRVLAGGQIIVPPGQPGLPDGFDPKMIDPDLLKFPKIPGERPLTGPVEPPPTAPVKPPPAGPIGPGTGTGITAAEGAVTTTSLGLGVTISVVAIGFIIGFVSPFVIGYALDRADEVADRPDEDEIKLPGGTHPPMQEPDAGAPAVDPNTGEPLEAPGPDTNPADAPGAEDGSEPLQFTPDNLPPTAQEFFDKVKKSKTPVVFRNLPLDVIDVLKAKYGCNLAAGLQQQGTIASYEAWQRVVSGCGGDFHAHHIVEDQVLRQLGYPVDQCPAVILTANQHIVVHNMINSLRPGPIDDMTKKQILKSYQGAYSDHPEWMSEVRRYLK